MHSQTDARRIAGSKLLTDQRVRAAKRLYDEHLPNWRFAVEAFEHLKKEDFGNKPISLPAVVAVDALFATGLRYRPGISERIACNVSSYRDAWRNKEPSPQQVEEIAKKFRKGSDGDGPLSFFSKFFHFYVSDDYPIFDSLACDVLLSEHGFTDTKNYSSFWAAIDMLRKEVEEEVKKPLSVREVDRYLWLMGKYVQWSKIKKKDASQENKTSKKPKEEGEVFNLFNTAEQRELLNALTDNDYEQISPRARGALKASVY